MKEVNEMTYQKYIKSMYRLTILYLITDLMFSIGRFDPCDPH